MEIHEMKLTPENFDAISRGNKQSELRLNDEKRQRIQVGDQIRFFRLPELQESLLVEVVSLRRFDDFAKLFEGVKDEYKNWEKASFVEGMYKHYSQEEELKYGALAINFRCLQ